MKLSNLSQRINVILEPLCLPFPWVTWFVHTKSSILNSPRGGFWMLSLKAIKISTCCTQNVGGSVCSKASCDIDDEAMGTSQCKALETLNPIPSSTLTKQTCQSCAKPNWAMCIVCEGRCCSNQCDVIWLTRMCGSRGKSIFGIYQSLHTHHPGTLMCIVYMREGVAAINAMSFGWQECVDQEERTHLGSIKVYTLTIPEP